MVPSPYVVASATSRSEEHDFLIVDLYDGGGPVAEGAVRQLNFMVMEGSIDWAIQVVPTCFPLFSFTKFRTTMLCTDSCTRTTWLLVFKCLIVAWMLRIGYDIVKTFDTM